MATIYGKGCFLVGHKFIHFVDGKVDTDDKAIIDAAMRNGYIIEGNTSIVGESCLENVSLPKRVAKKKVAGE